jgi:hypothetical protein
MNIEQTTQKREKDCENDILVLYAILFRRISTFYGVIFHLIYGMILTAIFGDKAVGSIFVISLLTNLPFSITTCSLSIAAAQGAHPGRWLSAISTSAPVLNDIFLSQPSCSAFALWFVGCRIHNSPHLKRQTLLPYSYKKNFLAAFLITQKMRHVWGDGSKRKTRRSSNSRE